MMGDGTEHGLGSGQARTRLQGAPGHLSHDFRNLLQCATSAMRVTERQLLARAENQLAQTVADALLAIDRANLLAHRLLGEATIAGQVKAVAAQDVVLGMRGLLRHAVGPAIQVSMLVCESLPPLSCDPRELENAILNLALNSRDAMPKGGFLTIELRHCCVPGHLGCIALSVLDTGSGMTAEVAAQALRPFFTTKAPGIGSGLGLSSVNAFAEQLGGSAELRSRVPEGTRVTLHLPTDACGPAAA